MKLGSTSNFDVPPEFVSSSKHARLQVSVCSSYDLDPRHTARQTASDHLFDNLSQLI